MRVLIVDDSGVMRKVVGKALREAGFELEEVYEAGNGIDAIEALRQATAGGRAPNLILCDIHMPKLDGLGFLRERAALGLDGAPVLMITADASDPLVAAAIAAGANGFVAKPFTTEHIRDRVRTVAGVL